MAPASLRIVPELPDALPRRSNALAKAVCRTLLAIGAWRVEGEFPPLPKQVAIVAPHTSNWDFIVGILAVFAIGIRVRFLIKHTLFWPPLGWFFTWCGGIPVNRTAPQGLVAQAVEIIERAPQIFLAITPEGTRKGKEWKSGFYRIAYEAKVPIFPVIFDGPARRIRFCPAFQPTGDYDADLPELLKLYEGVRGIKV
jgi:1-acyl-sn-glycerol-3-phosphate acyltransferase